MGTEQVGVGAAVVGEFLRGSVVTGWGEEAAQEFESSVAVAESCPEVLFPCSAPSSGFITSSVKACTAGLSQLWCECRRDLVAGMQAVQM